MKNAFILCALLLLLSVAAAAQAQSIPATLTTLHSFGGPDGAKPMARLLLGRDGNFYGAASQGGANDKGAIYKITPSGSFSMLHSFAGSDGAQPAAGLVEGRDACFYGTTARGGASEDGVVFKIAPAGPLTVLYSFTGGFDGSSPNAALVQGRDGIFYGTTYTGTRNDDGSVFSISASGEFSPLCWFEGGLKGANPCGALVEGGGGFYYGTASNIKEQGSGAIFKVNASGVMTTLYGFAGMDGACPTCALVLGRDGDLYGTTHEGGKGRCGTVFKITKTGKLTTLHSFAADEEGSYPSGGLILGKDGNFYGNASRGGASGAGTVFKITPTGALTTLYSFSGGLDGAVPTGDLVQGRDGSFYGVTVGGGTNDKGTVFKITPAM
jgi:uncharacterized repeat protein (TIGR03803 family)